VLKYYEFPYLGPTITSAGQYFFRNLLFRRMFERHISHVSLFLVSVLIMLATQAHAGSSRVARIWQCNKYGQSIQIWDDSVTPSGATLDTVNDNSFKQYIHSVTSYVATLIPAAKRCQPRAKQSSDISLIFVRLPLVLSGDVPLASPPLLPTSGPADACRLESPWVNLLYRQKGYPKAQAIFIWNERQLLADQYLLSQNPSPPPTDTQPLRSSTFHRYASDYADSEIQKSSNVRFWQRSNISSIPADILWLFRSSPQTRLVPFAGLARATMNTKVINALDDHLRLTKWLIEKCINAPPGTKFHYTKIPRNRK
jgi:hypothetical protein